MSARILLIAVFGTQSIATLIAVFGVGLVAPLGWFWALVVWGYALAWFLATDPVKLLAYHILDPATGSAPEPSAEPAPGAIAQPA